MVIAMGKKKICLVLEFKQNRLISLLLTINLVHHIDRIGMGILRIPQEAIYIHKHRIQCNILQIKINYIQTQNKANLTLDNS